MNELFEKVAKDAGIRIVPVIKTSPPSGVQCTLADLEKFAELIVKECIAAHVDDYGGDIIGDVLKNHFGIEE